MSSALTLYSSDQVRELDRIAIEAFGIPGFELMQRAAQAVFERIQCWYPDAKSVVVLCGTGNNGGDGFLVALLARKAQWDVKLIVAGDPASIEGDARLAMQAFEDDGGIIMTDASTLPGFFETADIVVDALLGTGLTRQVEGNWAKVIDTVNQATMPVIAIDVPSGLQSDRGVVLGTAIKADATVTFIGNKTGLVTGQARDYVGRLVLDDLAIPDQAYMRLKTLPNHFILSNSVLTSILPPRLRTSHKGHFGHVLLLGGDKGMSGAIRLAGEAALRSGAGLVTIATHPDHAAWLNLGRPELMVTGVKSSRELAPLLEKADVIGIGPGLGQSAWGEMLLSEALETDTPKILDADALNLLSLRPEKRANWILTPHPGEAARLLGVTVAAIEADRYLSARNVQKKFGGVCLLKGAGSLVADGTDFYVCTQGNPGMASGGMGDVLSGICCAILAQTRYAKPNNAVVDSAYDDPEKQPASLLDAAKAAVWLHANAADRAAREGEVGLLSADLFSELRFLINSNQPIKTRPGNRITRTGFD